MRNLGSAGLLVFTLNACCASGPGSARLPDGGLLPDGGRGDGGAQGIFAISPSTASLQITSGTPSSVQLEATLNGTAVQAAWVSGSPAVASVDTTGKVTASGPAGGSVTITATYENLSAAATVQVDVTQTLFVGGTGPSTVTAFSGTTPVSDPTKSPSFIYPYDAVVIPVNLQALDFQWKAGTGNDTYRITLSGTAGTLVAYVIPPTAAQPAWTPDAPTWTAFAEANIGQTITLDLAGTSSASPGKVYGATTQHITLAASRFAGTVYYWTTSGPGQVLQVSAAGQPQPVYTPPVGGPAQNQCMGCHTVSRDGTQMSAELWDSSAYDAGTVLNITQSPAVPEVPGGSYTWRFSTFDNTGDFLVTSWNGAFTLRQAQTGAVVPAGSGLDNLGNIDCGTGSTCTHPAWSADGVSLLFAKGLPTHFSYDVDFDQSDLMLSQWASSTQTFTTPTTLVASNYDGKDLANFHPTESIDNQLVAFNRGPCSRSDGTTACPTTCPQSACGVAGNVPPSSMYLVPITGGTPQELVNAEGPDVRNWFPNFSPFKEGGYHWLAFFSLRDYGWVTAGTNQRQLWVTAIDDSGQIAGDPSHPAFWLPGQVTNTDNDKAEWAPLPCVGQGSTCQGDIDCCNGLACRAVDAGLSECVPAATACAYAGDSCAQSSDCCSPFLCLQGTCGVQFN